LIKKRYHTFFPAVFFQFLVIKTLDPEPDPKPVPDPYPDSLEMLDIGPDPDSMNPDPQHFLALTNSIKRQGGYVQYLHMI
jgi:hypothetical protein